MHQFELPHYSAYLDLVTIEDNISRRASSIHESISMDNNIKLDNTKCIPNIKTVN
jgi:hypothetical protein